MGVLKNTYSIKRTSWLACFPDVFPAAASGAFQILSGTLYNILVGRSLF